MPNKLWVEVYRPDTIDGYVFQNETHKQRFTQYIADQSMPHVLFKGHRGTGKTTLARILKNELGVEDGDFKTINASTDNSVDVIRSTVLSFCQTMPLGDFKIILLDEADYLSKNAQAALRGMMEEYSDTVRFILTCNKPLKIIDELKSRCHEFEFKEFSRKEMKLHAFNILKKEGIKVPKEDIEILVNHVDTCYPDMRKLINTLEGNIVDGKLVDKIDNDPNAEVMIDMIEQLSEGKWLEVRANLVKNIDGDEWDEIYRFFYEHLDEVDGFDNITNWKRGILVIANHLRFHQQVADPEINFTACMIQLSDIV